MADEKKKVQTADGDLYSRIAEIIEQARQKAATAINLIIVYAYYEIGRYIVEDEQQGSFRAGYGKSVMKELSEKLTQKYGKGFSVDSLERMKKFYTLYPSIPISASPSRKSESIDENANPATVLRKSGEKSGQQNPIFSLSWSHYLVLIRIDNPDERKFYELEAASQQWSVRQLSRQYASSLFERLALSRNKDEVMQLAMKGHVLDKPADVLKDPITLEFLGLHEKPNYTESDLESAILSKLQLFLLEMGKGFLFEARQKRFTFDEQHFFVDLVLYNRLLQCYLLIDLKTDELKHQDLGQMQMYVNYYDRYVKQDFEKPTIGILLSKKQNKALVELTLNKDVNIYSAAYSLYLPDKTLLQSKLAEWMEEFELNKEQ